MKITVVILLLVLAHLLFAAPIPYTSEGWSTPVNGVKARFSFAEGNIVNGTRLIQVYLELKNVSDLGNPLYLYFDPSASVRGEVRNSANKGVKGSGGPFDQLIPSPYIITLPRDSTLIINVTANGWGVPKDEKALIGMMNDDWMIKRGDTAEYYLTGTFLAGQPPKEVDGQVWTGTIQIPTRRIDVLNPAKPGK
mgnify:CR=1 FL=1